MKTIFTMSLLFLAGCAAYDKVSDNSEAWVSERSFLVGETLFYCVSNKQASGQAMPVCHEAKFNDRNPNR